MSAQDGGVPRFQPQINANFRDLPTFTPQAQAQSAQMFNGLSQVFNGMLDQVNHIQAQRVKLEAQQAGAKAGLTPGFDANQLPNDPTIAAQTFRESALQSFSSQLELDRAEKFSQFQLDYEKLPDNEKDPTVLKTRFDSYIQGMASKLPEELRAPYMEMAVTKANPVVLNATQHYLATQQALAKADSTALVDALKKELLANPLPGNEAEQKAYDTRLVQWNKAMDVAGMTPNQKRLMVFELQQATEKAVGERKEQSFLNEFENASDKLQYFDSFVKAKPDKLGLNSETQNKLAASMQADINDQDFASKKNQQQLTFEQKTSIELAKNSIEEGIEKGTVTQAQLNQFIQKHKGHISPEWTASQLTGLQKKKKEELEADQKVHNFIAGKVVINPHDPGSQELMDEAVKRLTKITQPIEGAKISSGYGVDRGDHAHGGIDLAAPAGTPIRALQGGKVIYSGKASGFGNMVKVQMDDGFTMLVGHNATNNVKAGQRVEAGQMLGTVGSQGRSTGPHGHLEIYNPEGKRINPEDYLNRPNPLAGADPEKVINQLILKTGVIPTQYKNKLIASLHGTAQEQAQAADRFSWLQDHDIEVPGLTDRDEGLLARISAEINRGVPAETAVKIARQALDPSNENKLRGDAERVKKWLKQDSNSLEAVFSDGWFKEQKPSIPTFGGVMDNAKADWKAFLTEAGAQTGGDLDAAIRLAKRNMQIIYGYTQVNGAKQFVKYPPERYYGLRGYTEEQNGQWIKKQLQHDVAAKLPKGTDSNTLMLIPHRLTYREAASGKPSYLVFYKDKNGRFVQLQESGLELTFKPDSSAEVKRINAERAKALTSAKQAEMAHAQNIRQNATRLKSKPLSTTIH